MDFRLSDDDLRLRNEVSAAVAERMRSAPSGGDYDYNAHWPWARDFSRWLAERGWLVPGWPREHGGSGATYIQQLVITEELVYHDAPVSINTNRVGYTGPTIMVYGTGEQKRQHLQGIASAEVMWCQGFSEPGSGSDLAGLQTSAIRKGDDYVVNGQKIWTSYAHLSDWMILLARSDPDAPKHKGITFLLVDMKSPGITVRPLHNLHGAHHFNEVFFDDVRVPVANRLGEEHRGWYVSTTTLDFERSSVAMAAAGRRIFDDLVRALADTPSTKQRALTRALLADLKVRVEVGRLLCYQVAWMQTNGLVPNREASQAKIFNSELTQAVANTAVRLLGLRANDLLSRHGRFGTLYLDSVARTIGGGTSEIQRNILAQRGCGLPR